MECGGDENNATSRVGVRSFVWMGRGGFYEVWESSFEGVEGTESVNFEDSSESVRGETFEG